MRLILDRNYCSNPQAPTPACFFFLSRSVCFFLSTVSLNQSSTLHWLHLFFTFLLSFLMMGNSCSSWSCIFYFPQPFYLFFYLSYPSLLAYCLRRSITSFTSAPLWFLPRFSPFSSSSLLTPPPPFIPLPALFSPRIFLLSLPPSLCSAHLLTVMGLVVLNALWLSADGQTAAVLWWQHGATELNRADKSRPAAAHEYGMDCLKTPPSPITHTRAPKLHTKIWHFPETMSGPCRSNCTHAHVW